MAKQANISEKTSLEAQAIAKNIQKPRQTKEQTKLITQGIEKGIDLYKKQQKSKARDLDKALKKAKQQPVTETIAANPEADKGAQMNKLPWVLLAISWVLFTVVIMFSSALPLR